MTHNLTDQEALSLCVDALPNADVWHEISQDESIEIHEQAQRELKRLKELNDVVMCAYCGHLSNKGDVNAILDHTLTCEKRPEKKLLDKAFEIGDKLYARIIHLVEHVYLPEECEVCAEIAETLRIYQERD